MINGPDFYHARSTRRQPLVGAIDCKCEISSLNFALLLFALLLASNLAGWLAGWLSDWKLSTLGTIVLVFVSSALSTSIRLRLARLLRPIGTMFILGHVHLGRAVARRPFRSQQAIFGIVAGRGARKLRARLGRRVANGALPLRSHPSGRRLPARGVHCHAQSRLRKARRRAWSKANNSQPDNLLPDLGARRRRRLVKAGAPVG